MKKFNLFFLVALLAVLLCACSVGQEIVTESTAEALTSAYNKMLERNDLAVTYMIFGNSEPKKLYIEFANRYSREAVYGTEATISGNNATMKTFAYSNGYWYINDGNKKIAVSQDRLEDSLWILDIDFTDYKDILECISPSVILYDGFSADSFLLEKSSDLVSDTYEIKLNSSYLFKKELFINNFEERKALELLSYDGSITYYVGRNGCMKDIRLEFVCNFDKMTSPISVIVTLSPIASVSTLTKGEIASYSVM